ncbi:hypothetical protein I79_001924 [Cricetulus griseus]|uniref:Uncharacterized protein n=1 Tax=Cricetulus griseus TaxID=10029 RepID=G3GW14_CRIGR|nr:hypothetical protein I79_001924 [Cricetulus griseus]
MFLPRTARKRQDEFLAPKSRAATVRRAMAGPTPGPGWKGERGVKSCSWNSSSRRWNRDRANQQTSQQGSGSGPIASGRPDHVQSRVARVQARRRSGRDSGCRSRR